MRNRKLVIGIYSFLTILLLSSFSGIADKGMLTGKVTDAATNKPLVGASIFITEIKTGAVTKEDGTFTTPIVPSGKYLVEVSFQGYESNIQTIEINGTITKNFALKITYAEHENVTVTGVASAIKTKESVQPISIVKKTDLLKEASTNIIDALTHQVPGLTALSTGPAISKPIIRGLGYNRLVVVNDGVRQEGQQWGDEHGIEIDEYSIQKAEVLKGPASIIYGSDAMAGVVNFITNTPVAQGTVKANITSGFTDNNNLYSISGNVAANHANGFNWNVYGTYKNAASYHNKYDGYVLNSGFNERNFGGYIGLNKAWGYTHLMISNFDQKLGIIEGARDVTTGKFLIYSETPFERIATDSELKSGNLFTPYQHVQHFKIALDNNISVGNDRVNVLVAYQHNQRREFGDPSNYTTPDLYFNLQTVNYNLQYNIADHSGWKTSFGLNGMYQQNRNLASNVLIPEYNQFDIGSFILTRKTFNNNLTVSGGLRYDNRNLHSLYYNDGTSVKFSDFKRSFSNISGSAGISYNASNTVVLKLNVARGFRAPTVAELASNGAHEGTNRYEYGDVNLKSETSLQFDGGIEINTEHVSVNVSTFYNYINNYIFYRKLSNSVGTDSLVNANGNMITAFKFSQSNAMLYGAEFNIDIHPHPLDWLHFENSFSYVRGQFAENFGGSSNIPFMPAARLLSELRGNFKSLSKKIKNFYAKIELDNTFKQNNIFTSYNTETVTNGYSLLNFGIGGDVQHADKTLFSIYLSANNITDVAYQSSLSRLKYTDINNVTGRQGVFNMGRNFTVKINVPLSFKL